MLLPMVVSNGSVGLLQRPHHVDAVFCSIAPARRPSQIEQIPLERPAAAALGLLETALCCQTPCRESITQTGGQSAALRAGMPYAGADADGERVLPVPEARTHHSMTGVLRNGVRVSRGLGFRA